MDGAEATGPGLVRSSPAIDAGGIFLVLLTVLVFILPVLIYFPPTTPSKSEALLQTHTRVGLSSSSQSGLKDSTKPPSASSTLNNKIRSLWIYPVKSCKGIEVRQSRVVPSGLEFDRLYTFAQLRSPFPVGVDTPDSEKKQHKWEFITQRQFPLLATVQVELYVPDVIKARSQDFKSTDAFLILRFPWTQSSGLRGVVEWIAAKLARGPRGVPEKEILLPVSFPSEDEIEKRGYVREEVTIWRDTVTALNLEKDLPRELRLYLGVSNRLGIFRIDPARLREVHRCAPTKGEAGYQPVTGFQDAYPLHLLNLSSVRDLDAKIDKDDNLKSLDPRRFRANIIVDGIEAYDEETWKHIRFNPAPSSTRRHEKPKFHVSCRTVRCKLPNVDQESGFRHPVEPDRSLRKHREVDEGAKHMGCLGMQLTPLFEKVSAPVATGDEDSEPTKTDDDDDSEDFLKESWLEVGMEVDVLARGTHRYIRQ